MIDALSLGIIGMVLILFAFILNEKNGSINTETIEYNGINSLGSLLLLYYAYETNSIPFIVLNAVWFLVAGLKIFKILNLKNIIHKRA
ncbi:hypothetical protein GQ473_01040 [archaeon]|nr:hypothetical protein [archaeon]